MPTRNQKTVALKIALLLFLINALLGYGVAARPIEYPALSIDVYVGKKKLNISISSDDIAKAGINERYPDPHLEIEVDHKYHEEIKRLTEDNIGRRVTIRISGEEVFSGHIADPINKGKFLISCTSVDQAKQLLLKLGREKPDFHKQYSAEELSGAERYLKPQRNRWYRMAMDAYLKHDLKNAEVYAKEAIKREPLEPGHHTLLSVIYEAQGKNGAALEEMLTNERLSNKEELQRFPGTYLRIAVLYENNGKYDNAIKYYKKVQDSDKQNLQALLGIAEVYEKTGQIDLALENYRRLSESAYEYYRKKGLHGIHRLKKRSR